MKYAFFVMFLLMQVSCDTPSTGVSEEITRQFQSSGRTFVNLAKVIPLAWDKVCILGPYSTSTHAQETLGFSWPVEQQSTISTSDHITLLIFVKDSTIVELVEHPRRDGDFANLSRQCYAREQATFHHQTNPKRGWPGLFPKK